MSAKKFCIKGNLVLAPMSEITNLPFRLMCKKYGASLVYTEMINCDAFIMENNKTQKRTYFLEKERPVGIQIFGSSVEKLKKAATKIEKEISPDILDINIGCPAYNVMKTGSGASLLKKPEKIREIVSEISSSISIPLTCKIRILSDDKKTIQITKIIEKSGASAISVHGRTAKQGYSGKANWDVINKIKKSIKIPVILNGDIFDEFSAEKALKETGCDAVMIGRAAIGNPYLFKRINHYLKTGNLISFSLKHQIKDFREYLKISKKYDFLDLNNIKIQAFNFIKGFEGSKKIRKKISESKKIEEIERIMDNIEEIIK